MMPLLPDNSPFRILPQNLKPDQVILFDGFRYAVDMIELVYVRLAHNLYNFNYGQENVKLVGVFADAWQLICHIDMFQNIIRRFGISGNDPLLSDFEKVKGLRNTFQHIDERLENTGQFGEFPAFGSVSWYGQKEYDDVEGLVTYLYSGTVANKEKISTSRVGTIGGGFGNLVRGIQLNGIVVPKGTKKGKEENVDLSSLTESVKNTVDFLDKQLREEFTRNDLKGKHLGDLIIKMAVNHDPEVVKIVAENQNGNTKD